MADRPTLTTTAGAPVSDNQNSRTAGQRGPVLLEDYQLLEKLAHQNRERIPERVVHAKGWGAYRHTEDHRRHFEVHQGQGAAARYRERRCFCASPLLPASSARPMPSVTCAVLRCKFYTSEGNWDLVGNNTPVFFVRDPLKFPDFIHTQKRHPRTNMRPPQPCGISGRCRPKACIR